MAGWEEVWAFTYLLDPFSTCCLSHGLGGPLGGHSTTSPCLLPIPFPPSSLSPTLPSFSLPLSVPSSLLEMEDSNRPPLAGEEDRETETDRRALTCSAIWGGPAYLPHLPPPCLYQPLPCPHQPALLSMPALTWLRLLQKNPSLADGFCPPPTCQAEVGILPSDRAPLATAASSGLPASPASGDSRPPDQRERTTVW